MLAERIKDYMNGYNLIDIIAMGLTTVFVFDTLFEIKNIDTNSLRIIAALNSFLLSIKIFDWLRLFDATAFYILLI